MNCMHNECHVILRWYLAAHNCTFECIKQKNCIKFHTHDQGGVAYGVCTSPSPSGYLPVRSIQ